MVTWTKQRVAQQLAWSNACYRDAISAHYGHLLKDKEKKLPIRELKEVICNKLDLDIRHLSTPEVTTLYLNNLCQLSTEKLELIVDAYNKGKQWRSASTIDVLLSELFERATNSGVKYGLQ